MRTVLLLLAVLLSASCSHLLPPTKICDGTDVCWIYSNFQILRCWQHKIGAPVCMVAVTLNNPIANNQEKQAPPEPPAAASAPQ